MGINVFNNVGASFLVYDQYGNLIPPDSEAKPSQADVFTPTDNQTVFALSTIPNLANKPILQVNGQIQENTSDYTIIGNILNWISNHFSLSSTDRVIIYYSN